MITHKDYLVNVDGYAYNRRETYRDGALVRITEVPAQWDRRGAL